MDNLTNIIHGILTDFEKKTYPGILTATRFRFCDPVKGLLDV